MTSQKIIGTESSIKMHYTKDYGQFRLLKGNRDLDEGKIKRIMRSIENGLEFFKYCPIMVNEEGFIIDGQHRFYVCKKLGLNVYYVVVPNFTLRQVAEMNSNSSKWKDRDYLNCYVDVNLEPYKRLDEFLKEYAGVSIGVAVTLLHTGHVQAGSGSRDDFRDGLFKANYIHEAHQLMKKVLDFQNYCESYTSRSFIKAVEELIQSPEYDHQAFLEKLQIHSLVIDQKSTHKEYLQHMEDLFNFRNSKRRRIY